MKKRARRIVATRQFKILMQIHKVFGLIVHYFYREEIKANEEPFEKERALVATLIVYCQKLDPNSGPLNSGPPNSSDPGSDENCSSKNSSIEISDDSSRPAAALPEIENCTVYRKNDEDDILFAGVKKNMNSNKKSAKPKKQKVSSIFFCQIRGW